MKISSVVARHNATHTQSYDVGKSGVENITYNDQGKYCDVFFIDNQVIRLFDLTKMYYTFEKSERPAPLPPSSNGEKVIHWIPGMQKRENV